MKYFVTPGTSLTTSSRCWRSKAEIKDHKPRDESLDGLSSEDLVRQARARHPLEELDQRRREALGTLSERPRTELPDTYLERIEQQVIKDCFDERCWSIHKRHLLSAELATICTMHRSKPGGPPEVPFFTGKDEFVFMYSTSNECDAFVNAAIVRAMCKARRLPLEPGRVMPLRLPADLDPLNTGHFEAAMNELWNAVTGEIPGGDVNPQVAFIVTGGYKAVTLDLALRLGFTGKTTRLYYLHEDPNLQSEYAFGLICLDVVDGKRPSWSGI